MAIHAAKRVYVSINHVLLREAMHHALSWSDAVYLRRANNSCSRREHTSSRYEWMHQSCRASRDGHVADRVVLETTPCSAQRKKTPRQRRSDHAQYSTQPDGRPPKKKTLGSAAVATPAHTDLHTTTWTPVYKPAYR